MLRSLFVSLFCLLLALGCHSQKKSRSGSSANRPKPKPKTSTPVTKPTTKPPTTKPTAPTPASGANPSSQLVFTESDLLSPVLEKAQKEKRSVFVVFSASWCAPCQVMRDEVFTQKPTYTYLNKNFINYEVDFDSDSGQNIAAIYEVKSLPTILFLNPQGVVLERKTGMATHTNLVTMGDAALAKLKK